MPNPLAGKPRGCRGQAWVASGHVLVPPRDDEGCGLVLRRVAFEAPSRLLGPGRRLPSPEERPRHPGGLPTPDIEERLIGPRLDLQIDRSVPFPIAGAAGGAGDALVADLREDDGLVIALPERPVICHRRVKGQSPGDP